MSQLPIESLQSIEFPSRQATVERNTAETKIKVRINLDGTGEGVLDTGVPFLNHMLDQIKRHGLIDLDVKCDGDTEIDDHMHRWMSRYQEW